MLHQEISFEKRAEFLRLNVCDFPVDLTANRIKHVDAEQIVEGLRDVRQLLIEIYSDTVAYRAEDPLESYHNLTNTILFLYVAGITGELESEGDRWCTRVDKSKFKKQFKKPPSFQFEVLSNYGFYFEYFKNRKEVDTYKSCDTFIIHYENSSCFALAIKYLLDRMPIVDNKKDYALVTDLFSKADFAGTLLQESIKRQDISPVREDIMRSTGNSKELWKEISTILNGKYMLKAKCNLWSYCSPHWIIHFMNKSKAICVFTIIPDMIDFEMSLPFEKSKEIVSIRKELAQNVCRSIESLRCINCGRCKGNRIEFFDGVRLCSLNAEARRLYLCVTSLEEIDSISKIIEIVLK